MEWGDNWEFTVALATGAISFFAVLTGLVQSWIQRRLARRQMAADLYRAFYSADNYRRIAVPVFRLSSKWFGYDEQKRTLYRDTVCKGWLTKANASETMALYNSPELLALEPDVAHFRHTIPSEQFAEHESLTAFLYFWVSSEQMIRSGLVSKGLFRDLFAGSLTYYNEFLKSFIEHLEEMGETDQSIPWIDSIRRIQALTKV
ncbi:MAG: hypothetical protein AAF950_08030 [Pseudomonadota bacterium]